MSLLFIKCHLLVVAVRRFSLPHPLTCLSDLPFLTGVLAGLFAVGSAVKVPSCAIMELTRGATTVTNYFSRSNKQFSLVLSTAIPQLFMQLGPGCQRTSPSDNDKGWYSLIRPYSTLAKGHIWI